MGMLSVASSRVTRRPRFWWSRGAVLALAAGLVSPLAAAGTNPSREYELKAVFLYHFARFVTWPESAFASREAPFCIGVLGDDPFGAVLDEVVRHEVVDGHALVVQRFRDLAEVTNCQMLFICRSESARQESIITALRGRPILTVSENADFAIRGGMIRLLTESNKVRLRVNAAAAEAAGLQISSQLLRSAQIVSSAEPR